jgi:hypothetical protein
MKYIKRDFKKMSLLGIVFLLLSLNTKANAGCNDQDSLMNSKAEDWIHGEDGKLNVQGTVMLSDETEFIIVQVGNTFMRLHRNLVRGVGLNALDNPGSRILIQIPSRAISHVWSMCS